VRFVVYGAGAIGGVVAARLLETGYDVGVISRGEHGRTIARHGLRIESPEGAKTLHPQLVADQPAAVDWRPDDLVLLAVKSQDTVGAVTELARWAPASVVVACLQNGVANERTALRWFVNVYGVAVMCPAAHLKPGTVVAYSSPTSGLLDVGRYPEGEDGTAEAIAKAFNDSTLDSLVRPDIMRWKYAKLVLMNLSNAVDALCGPGARGGRLSKIIRDEGIAALRAAGIDFASEAEDRERRGHLLQLGEVPGRPRGGSSSWQSLARATGTIEADYLNGEIALLGRLHGIATPANERMQQLANRAAREHWPPGTVSEDDVLAELEPGRS
jgi:2-dehydropantoate 2-reductase